MARLSLALVALAVLSLAHAGASVRVGPAGSYADEKTILAGGYKPIDDRFHVKVLDSVDGDDVTCITPPCDKPLRIAGYFKLDRTYDAHMFFYFFESRKPDTACDACASSRECPCKDPVIVWMTGGPGCSSELAVFYENGPYRINDDLSVTLNPFGWDAMHNTIFVDQPINTGFSFSQNAKDEVFDEKTVAADMVDFLSEFYAKYDKYANNPLFITGESYAGHYVPAVTRGIYDANKESSLGFNLQGFAIGNGLTNPYYQYQQYGNYSFTNGIIDEETYANAQAAIPKCIAEIQTCDNSKENGDCLRAVNTCQGTIVGPILQDAGDINVYDIRKQCGANPLCYDFSNMDKYLAQPQVRYLYNIPSFIQWEACSDKVHTDFMHDWMLNYEPIIPEMLENGIRLMIYAGVEDFICNWMGNYAWVSEMAWAGADGTSGQDDFNSKGFKEWKSLDGKSVAGEVKSSGPLSFVKVAAAGHMVPMDQPENALKMIYSFTQNTPLV